MKNRNNEIWKDIDGYEDYYQISSLGNVRSKKRMVICKNGSKHFYESRVIKHMYSHKGYVVVALSKGSITKEYRVHRLVAIAFLANPLQYEQVNHKDEDKSNNTVENLEWCDVQYNTHYGTRVQRIASKNLNDPSRSKEVAMYDKTGVFLKKYPSLCEARRDTNISDRLISSCCRGYRKSAKGYIFAYANEGLVKQQKRYRCFLDKLKAKKNKGRNV